MAKTYTSLHFHVVFSTRGREPWLTDAAQDRLWPYLGGSRARTTLARHRVEFDERYLLGRGQPSLRDGSSLPVTNPR